MNKRVAWTYRLQIEERQHVLNKFVTLTYSDENMPEKMNLVKSDLQAYIKRLRYYFNFRYFAVGEYGEKNKRPHYHILMFGVDPNKLRKIGECWTKGIVHIGKVQNASIHYCTKDLLKFDKKKFKDRVDGFRLISSRPAIGSQQIKFMMNKHIGSEFTVDLNGRKIVMPRYYRDRIFNVMQKMEYTEKMIKESDKRSNEIYDRLKEKGVDHPLEYLQKEQEMLIRQEKLQLKNRKL